MRAQATVGPGVIRRLVAGFDKLKRAEGCTSENSHLLARRGLQHGETGIGHR